MHTLALLLLLALIASLWLHAMRARERAVAACTAACRAYDVQLLDSTVALAGLGLERALVGWRVRRTYQFAFSRDGHDRLQGCITLVGAEVEAIHFAPPAEIT